MVLWPTPPLSIQVNATKDIGNAHYTWVPLEPLSSSHSAQSNPQWQY
ncbi:MAG: hypothetical protein ACI855_005326, partial [Myxococcota bacterium]